MAANRIRSKVPFSGVPAGTEGSAERDGDLWKVTWALPDRSKRLLIDWFDSQEYADFLEELKE